MIGGDIIFCIEPISKKGRGDEGGTLDELTDLVPQRTTGNHADLWSAQGRETTRDVKL
jgi:hypothetical protein